MAKMVNRSGIHDMLRQSTVLSNFCISKQFIAKERRAMPKYKGESKGQQDKQTSKQIAT